MKRNVLTLLFCMVAMVAFNTHSNAQSTIYLWDFNAADTTVPPSYTAPGAGSASFDYWCAYIDYTTGSFVNLQPGDYVGSCIRFRNPADSVTFIMPSTHYKNLKFSYAEQRTGSGASTNMVLYTRDGVNFIPTSAVDVIDSSTYTVDSTDALTDTAAATGWEFHTFSFAADTLTNNNPHFAITIVFVGVSGATSGNDRFDNVVLKGDTTSAASTDTTVANNGVKQIANVPTVYTLYPNPAGNTLDITADMDGDKTIVITDMVGQKVYSSAETGKHFTVNTAYLNPGYYFISIRENTTGAVNTMKFIKQ